MFSNCRISPLCQSRLIFSFQAIWNKFLKMTELCPIISLLTRWENWFRVYEVKHLGFSNFSECPLLLWWAMQYPSCAVAYRYACTFVDISKIFPVAFSSVSSKKRTYSLKSYSIDTSWKDLLKAVMHIGPWGYPNCFTGHWHGKKNIHLLHLTQLLRVLKLVSTESRNASWAMIYMS